MSQDLSLHKSKKQEQGRNKGLTNQVTPAVKGSLWARDKSKLSRRPSQIRRLPSPSSEQVNWFSKQSFIIIWLIDSFTYSPGWNRQHHSQTIHPTEKLISMNLCIILWVVTWAWLFLTPMVMEAVRGQKRYSKRTLWHFISMFTSSHSTISA